MSNTINWPTVAISIVTAGFTAGATVATGAFGYLNKDRDLDIEMVRISLSILSGENKDTSLNGRKYALGALEKFSGVDIPVPEFEEWAATGTVPKFDISDHSKLGYWLRDGTLTYQKFPPGPAASQGVPVIPVLPETTIPEE